MANGPLSRTLNVGFILDTEPFLILTVTRISRCADPHLLWVTVRNELWTRVISQCVWRIMCCLSVCQELLLPYLLPPILSNARSLSLSVQSLSAWYVLPVHKRRCMLSSSDGQVSCQLNILLCALRSAAWSVPVSLYLPLPVLSA